MGILDAFNPWRRVQDKFPCTNTYDRISSSSSSPCAHHNNNNINWAGLGDQSTANDARETCCSRDTLLLLVLIGMGPSSIPSSVGAISQCGHDRPPWLVQSSKILSRDWRMRMIIYEELVEVAAFIWCLKIGLASADIEKARARGK